MFKDKPSTNQSADTMLVNRLDTISLLIQGNDVCGSASFDGENLLLATNKTEQSPLVKSVKEFFTFVAKKGKEIEQSPEREEVVRKEIAEKTDQLVAAHKTQVGSNQPQSAEDYRTSLNKITKSILATYIEPHYRDTLSKEFSTAIENRQYNFIPGEEGAHAEMKIAGKLLETKKLDNQNVVVGISKRCCENCGHMIEAINEVKGFKGGGIKEIIAMQEEGTPLIINTRIPTFLRNDSTILPLYDKKAIEERFLKHARVNSLEEAYKNRLKIETAAPEVVNLLHEIHASKAQEITKDSHLTPTSTPSKDQPANPAPVLSIHGTPHHKKP
jgi:hypothetical protein